jgi:hypothetical protein
LSFAKERIGPLAAIITTVFCLLTLYLFELPNIPKNQFASIYSETLIKTTSQHLLLLVGFDTLIYRKYYDTPPILVGHQATRLKIFGDSNLVVQQVMNRCDAISDNMTAYRNLYNYLEGTFDGCEVSHVSRASSEEADNLANIGSQCLPILPGVFWEEIIERSIKNTKNSTTEEQGQHQTKGSGAGKPGKGSTSEPEEVMMIEETWMQPYFAYMINKALPEDTVEARRIIRRSKAFVVSQGKLYKKSITGVLQRCVTPQEGQEILKDIHAGVCGHHASSKAIAAKAFRAGFYWLTAIEDVKDIVRKCEACQWFASRPHALIRLQRIHNF